MERGLLIILSGPSGVGKGTIRKYFEKDERLNLAYSTSMTTRKPRAGEVDGKDYFFSTREDFEKAIKEGGLLEWAEFVGNYYGTPLKEVNRLRDEGKNVLLEIEVQGAIQVQEKCPDAVSIFIIPPSMEELERRIRGRSTEPEEIIQQRLAKASNEMKMVSQYKYIVCNDDPKLAAELIKTITKEKCMDNLKEWIEEVLNENGCHLYDLEWITNQGTPLLRVSVEKEDGTMDLDTCASCSDVIGQMLDEKDWYAHEYMLEVCSPGAERELRTDEEVQRAVGKYVFVKMKDPKQGLDQVVGDLVEATEKDVTISYREKTRTKKITIEKSNIQLIMTAVKV